MKNKEEIELFTYKIYQDCKEIKVFKNQTTDLEPFKWLLRNQGQSVNWALKHGGYKVEEINSKEESKFWQPYN